MATAQADSQFASPLASLRDEVAGPNGRSPASIAISVGVHGLILVGIAALARDVVQPVKRTERTVLLVSGDGGRAAPPPLKGSLQGRPAPAELRPVAPVRPALVAPSAVREVAVEAAVEPADGAFGDPSGVEWGTIGGNAGSWGDGSIDDPVGGPGGTGGPGTGAEGAGIAAAPLRVTHATLVRRVEPEYPRVAIKTGREGTVVLDAVIDGQGRVVDITPLLGDELLVKASIAAVRQWLFEPATIDGRPRDVVLTVSVVFHLNR